MNPQAAIAASTAEEIKSLTPPPKRKSSCKVSDLQCEYLTNPLGLDELRPRFSWKILSNRQGTGQGAYRIQVEEMSDTGRRRLVWDSGQVESDASVLIEYEGPELQPHTRYVWRVRIWDERQQLSDWSEPAFWETGFLGTAWPADWINSRVGKTGAADQPCRYLRHGIQLPSKPVSARLYITALGLFEPWINGERVGRDWLTPGWTDYATRLEYLTYDVTDQLTVGRNVIGAILSDGWYCGFLSLRKTRNNYGAEPSLLAVLRVVDRDGQVSFHGTGSKWHGTTGALRAADIYMGETYDARREDLSWCSSEVEESRDQQANLAQNPGIKLEGKSMPPSRVVEELPARTVTEPRKGAYVFDFGQNMVGVVRIKVSAAAGTKITLRHGEMLNADGTIYTENLRTALSTDTYICRGGGVETYTPRFTFHGFRYLEIRGLSQLPAVDMATGLVLQSDLRSTGYFSCSHELINQLQSNISWGQRGNFLEVPMDCPQRDERLGWTGDAQIFCRTSTFNYDVAPFFRKWMTDVRDAQYEDGSYPDVAPDLLRVSNGQLNRIPPHPHSGNAAYAEAGVICPWVIYERYGDVRILRENYPAMCRWMDYQVRTAKDYICPPTSYGDWLATDAVKPSWGPTPCELVGTAYFAYAAQLMIRIAGILGESRDEARFVQIRKNVVAAFRREFLTLSGRVVGDTQTGYLLAIAFDLIPQSRLKEAAKYLENTLAKRNFHLSTGFVGTPLLCPVLSRIGRTDLAYRLLLNETYPSWLFPVRNGATTVWERWNSWTPEAGFGEVNMNSFNHYAYGAIGEWLYGHVAGIQSDPECPGFKHIIFRAEPGPGLTSAEARLESPYGHIESAWVLDDRAIWKWRVFAPPNTRATIEFPLQAQMELARVNGRPLGDSESIIALRERRYSLPPGKYLFEVPLSSPLK